MIRAYSVEQVRAAEQRGMATLPAGELMARAAFGLAEVAAARLGPVSSGRVVALVGTGNNGADAMYAIRKLSADGHSTAVIAAGDRVDAAALAALAEADITVLQIDPASGPTDWEPHKQRCAEVLAGADVVLDAVTGLGARPGLEARVVELVDLIGEQTWVLSVDLPSGADPAGAGGPAEAELIFADETVTFGVPKPVHLSPDTELACGSLTIVDIGLDLAGAVPVAERFTAADVAARWPVPGPGDHKYTRGVVGVVAGSSAYPGAGVLAALGAVSSGAGMVRYVGPDSVAQLVLRHAPEVVVRPGRVQAWVLGSGLDLAIRPGGQVAPDGRSGAGGLGGADAAVERDRALAAIREALAGDLPVVVDAGALDLPDLPDLLRDRRNDTVLTPHAGELAQLLTMLRGRHVARAQVESSLLAHAREAADTLGVIVLLKGVVTTAVPPTVSGQPWRSQADAPAWLATAGSGDVLAGLLGTLLAAGVPALDAAPMAAHVHGVAADLANPGGPVRAFALVGALPRAVAAMLREGRRERDEAHADPRGEPVDGARSGVHRRGTGADLARHA